MTVELNETKRAWARQRRLFLAYGFEAEVAQIDALLEDGDMALTSPDTFWHEVNIALNSMRDRAAQKISHGQVPVDEFREWLEYRDEFRETSRAKATERLGTARGLSYQLPFLLAWRRSADLIPLYEDQAPSVRDVVGEELERARNGRTTEVQVRALAAATAKVVEVLYKPLLRVLWQVQEWTLGGNRTPPDTTCGRLRHQVQGFWDREANLPPNDRKILPLDDFMLDGALAVRNAHSHPENIRFDPVTEELVEDRGPNGEQRWTKTDLAKIAGEAFHKCLVMGLAFTDAYRKARAHVANTSGGDE